MAIRKRYVGGIRLQERQHDVFVEGVAISKITRQKMDIVREVRNLTDDLLDRLGLSYGDIDAFVVANSLGGLFGIPDFMRYVFPTAFGSHKNVYETACDESAGLCALVRAYRLIKAGLFSRICVVSAMQVNLKNIDRIRNIIFADTIADMENITEEYVSKDREGYRFAEKLFSRYCDNASRNQNIDRSEVKKSKYNPSELPHIKNSACVCIVANRYATKVKNVKIEYADEITTNATTIHSSLNEVIRFVLEQVKEKPQLIEISSISPVIDSILLRGLGVKDLESETLINPSGGTYFMNSPPVSSLLAFAHLYLTMVNAGKKRGFVISVSTRSLDHFGVAYLVSEAKS